MRQRELRNRAASVRQRLLNRSRETGRPFDELLRFYGMERFLYRLSESAHAERFLLKGGLMLVAWRSLWVRPTMDVDLLGHMPNDQAGRPRNNTQPTDHGWLRFVPDPAGREPDLTWPCPACRPDRRSP